MYALQTCDGLVSILSHVGSEIPVSWMCKTGTGTFRLVMLSNSLCGTATFEHIVSR